MLERVLWKVPPVLHSVHNAVHDGCSGCIPHSNNYYVSRAFSNNESKQVQGATAAAALGSEQTVLILKIVVSGV